MARQQPRDHANGSGAGGEPPRQSSPLDAFRKELKGALESNAFMQSLVDVLRDPELARRYVKVALLSLNRRPANDKLFSCTQMSFMAAILEAAELRLEIGSSVLAQAYLVPRFDKEDGLWKACFQASWKGKAELARRSGLVEAIDAVDVHVNDEFEYWRVKVDHPEILHRVKIGDRGPVIGYYAIAYFKSGRIQVSDVWDVRQIERHRDKFSKQPNGSAWIGSADAMARKTMMHQLEAYLPLSPEQQQVYEGDDDIPTTFKVDATVQSEETVASEEAPNAPGRATPGGEKPPASAQPPPRSRALAAAQDAAIDLPALTKDREQVPAGSGSSVSAPERPASGKAEPKPTAPVDPGPCEKSEHCLRPAGHEPPCSDGFDEKQAADPRPSEGLFANQKPGPAMGAGATTPAPQPRDSRNAFHNGDRVRVKKNKSSGTVVGYKGSGVTTVYSVKLDDIGEVWEFTSHEIVELE